MSISEACRALKLSYIRIYAAIRKSNTNKLITPYGAGNRGAHKERISLDQRLDEIETLITNDDTSIMQPVESLALNMGAFKRGCSDARRPRRTYLK